MALSQQSFAQTKLVSARDIGIAVVCLFCFFKKEIILFLNLYSFIYLFRSCDIQDLGSSARERNHAPCNGRE